MKWVLKDKYADGQKRTVTRFLFFPKRIGDTVKWLWFYKIKQVYYSGDYYDTPMWLDKEWV